MTIGILQCGAVPQRLAPVHGSYAAMMRRLLGPDRESRVYDVTSGALPDDAARCEAYVLTGSPAGVYDPLPWIPELLTFLRQARGRAKLVGICFGHQAMAQAFGGAVIKSSKGWGVGLHRYDVAQRAAWMDDLGHVDIPASHQDQVTALPPGARVTLASAFTPFAGLDYGDAISFQCHPEFAPDFATALIEGAPERYGDMAAAAIASHAGPDDCARVGGWIGRFLDGAAAP